MRRRLSTTLPGILAAAASVLSIGCASAAAGTLSRPKLPPTATLTILTTTVGGIGGFAYIAGPYDDDPTRVTAATRHAGVRTQARPERNLRLLSTNRYVIQQFPFAKAAGRWVLTSVVCNGSRRTIRREPISQVRYVRLRLRFGHSTVCSFIDRFVPATHAAPSLVS